MALPGFAAERSLSVSRGHYVTNGAGTAYADHVVPQLQVSGGFGSTCWRVCNCCRRSGNTFCCSHCRWCSGPIGFSDLAFQ